MSKPEQKIQIAVCNWMRLRYPDLLFTISPAGMIRGANTAVLMKRLGYRNGTPDILIFEPRGRFHGLFIELKAEKGYLSEDQRVFIAKAVFLRYATAVCFSYEEAIKTVENYMNLPIGKGVNHEQDQGCGPDVFAPQSRGRHGQETSCGRSDPGFSSPF